MGNRLFILPKTSKIEYENSLLIFSHGLGFSPVCFITKARETKIAPSFFVLLTNFLEGFVFFGVFLYYNIITYFSLIALIASFNFGRIFLISPTIPRSAISKIAASSSLLIAIISSEFSIPAAC